MALNPSSAISLAGPSAGQSIAVELGVSATATISLNDTNVRTLAGVSSGVIVMPTDFWGKSSFTPTQKAILAFGGQAPSPASLARFSSTNLISSSGVMASDTPGVPGVSARLLASGATYGGDKVIFAYGSNPNSLSVSNLVSNTGVMASDTPGVPGVIARSQAASSTYGGDKVIFAYGNPVPAASTITTLVSNTGVIGSDAPVAGTARSASAGASYGGNADKAIIAFGGVPATPFIISISNLISNTGVVASDTPGVGTARSFLAALNYGGDKAIFGFGRNPLLSPGAVQLSLTNLVSNTGVVASDTPGVGEARSRLGATNYGGDKGIFTFGDLPAFPGFYASPTTNLVSNTGIVASNVSSAGTQRYGNSAAGYSTTA